MLTKERIDEIRQDNADPGAWTNADATAAIGELLTDHDERQTELEQARARIAELEHERDDIRVLAQGLARVLKRYRAAPMMGGALLKIEADDVLARATDAGLLWQEVSHVGGD